jgi:hypothetical protein
LLETDPAEPAHPASVQDRRDRRERHRQQLGDLGRGHPQAAQGDDRRDAIGGSAIRDMTRRRGAISEPVLARGAVTVDPLPCAADADPGGPGRRRQRPTLDDDQLDQPPPTAPTESRVTVKLHPGPPSD